MYKQISGRRATDLCLAAHLLKAFDNTDPEMPGLKSFLARPNFPPAGEVGKMFYSKKDNPKQIRREIGFNTNFPIPLPLIAFSRLPGYEPIDEGPVCISNKDTTLTDADTHYLSVIRLNCHVNYVVLNYKLQFFADDMDAADSYTDLMAFFLMGPRYSGSTLVGTGMNFSVPYEVVIPAGAVAGAEEKGEYRTHYYVHCEILSDTGRKRGLPFDPIDTEDRAEGFNFGVSLDLRVKTAIVMGENARVDDSLITEIGEITARS